VNEVRRVGEKVVKSKNSVVKFGNNEDSGFGGPEEPVQHIPEIDVSDEQMERDRKNETRAVTHGDPNGVDPHAK
jgi:hypothetical protein